MRSENVFDISPVQIRLKKESYSLNDATYLEVKLIQLYLVLRL